MRTLLALLLLLVASPAAAITTPQHGAMFQIGAGGTFDLGAPSYAGPGWSGGVAWWWGRYDDVYAIGRFTALGITARQAWIAGALETIPALELRRGSDVIVVGYHGFVSAGPVFRAQAIGAEVLVGGGVKWRFKPKLGLGLKLGAGAAWVDGAWSARAIARVTFEAAVLPRRRP